MKNINKLTENPTYFILSLPNLIIGVPYLLYLLSVVVFILKFRFLFVDQNIHIFTSALIGFGLCLLIAFANIYNFLLIGFKKKVIYVILIIPLLFVTIISFIGVNIFYPYPNFDFAEKCSAINGKPFNLKTINSLKGFCFFELQNGKSIPRECSQKDLDNYSSTNSDLSVSTDDTQFSCFVKNSTHGVVTRLSYQFD